MPQYETGYVRHPDKDFLMMLSDRRHRRMMAGLIAVPAPPTWDSAALGWIGPVKNQKQCGSCWDFSGTGIVEVAYNKAGVGGGPSKFILSEEYTLSCYRNGGCGGDDNVTVLDWAKSHGLPLTSDYGPYQQRAGQCSYKPQMPLYKVDDWGFADGQSGDGVTSVEAIKAAIMQYGAVGCAIADDDAFQNNPAGTVFQGNATGINHEIILYGWGDGYWLLRNSWGEGWCDKGNCNIAFGANSVGTEAVWAKINAVAPPIDWLI